MMDFFTEAVRPIEPGYTPGVDDVEALYAGFNSS